MVFSCYLCIFRPYCNVDIAYMIGKCGEKSRSSFKKYRVKFLGGKFYRPEKVCITDTALD